MKILLSTFYYLGILVLPCYSGFEMVWQTNLSSHGTLTSYSNPMLLDDGSVYITLSNSGNGCLLVYESNGNLRFKDSFSLEGATSLWTQGVSGGSSRYITIALSKTGEQKLRVYEYLNGEYTISQSPWCNSWTSTYTSYPKSLPNVFVAIEGTYLQKYRLSGQEDPPLSIGGAVASGTDGVNYILNWNSISGASYQIQSSTNLIDWANIGSPITGTGSAINWANALSESQGFFRVIEL